MSCAFLSAFYLFSVLYRGDPRSLLFSFALQNQFTSLFSADNCSSHFSEKVKKVSYEIHYLASSQIYLFLCPGFPSSLLSLKEVRGQRSTTWYHAFPHFLEWSITAFLLVNINSKCVSSRGNPNLLTSGCDWLCFYRQESKVQKMERNAGPLTCSGVWFWGTHLQGLHMVVRVVCVFFWAGACFPISSICADPTHEVSHTRHLMVLKPPFSKSGFLILRRVVILWCHSVDKWLS